MYLYLGRLFSLSKTSIHITHTSPQKLCSAFPLKTVISYLFASARTSAGFYDCLDISP